MGLPVAGLYPTGLLGEFMSKSLFFRTLFDEGEGICTGGMKATNVSSHVFGNFFSINPLKNRRADLNVTNFRNFLFEMDSVELEDQLKILETIGAPITSLVYSGGKSYHAIISLEEPLKADEGTREGVDTYKAVWARMATYMDAKAIEAGFEFSGVSLFDSACKNPSRLSRIPDVRRNNGNLQKLVGLNNRISRSSFLDYFGFEYDEVEVSSDIINSVSLDIQNTREFWQLCPTGLKNELKYADWADSAGMYPKLLKLTLWAIDSTGVDKDTFIEALWEKTFPQLLDAGYPSEKLTVAVDHAYNQKRRS